MKAGWVTSGYISIASPYGVTMSQENPGNMHIVHFQFKTAQINLCPIYDTKKKYIYI